MPLEKSAQIKSDADALLKTQGFEALLAQFGEVIYTGSYALDLMVWNDIDLYVVPKPGIDWDQCASDMSAAFIRRKDVDVVRVEKSFWRKKPELPKGISIGVKIPQAGYKLPWKLDIWIVDEQTRMQNKVMMDSIRAKLTHTNRDLIIRAKTALINDDGRTPSLSGVQVYQAVLEKGLTSAEDIVSVISSLRTK